MADRLTEIKQRFQHYKQNAGKIGHFNHDEVILQEHAADDIEWLLEQVSGSAPDGSPPPAEASLRELCTHILLTGSNDVRYEGERAQRLANAVLRYLDAPPHGTTVTDEDADFLELVAAE